MPKRITKKDIVNSQQSYHNYVMQYGERNEGALNRLVEIAELKAQYEKQHTKKGE